MTLTVSDEDGGSIIDSFDVTVENVAPQVEAGDDIAVAPGESFNLSGSFTDEGVEDTHSTLWLFGDGFAAVTLDTEYQFDEPGQYTITLRVTDDDFGVGEDTLTVTVGNPDDTPPVVNATTINNGRDQRTNTLNLTFEFSEDVSASLTLGDIVLFNNTLAQAIDISGASLDYDLQTNIATLDLSAVDLPDGDYTATLTAAGISDAALNLLDGGVDFTVDFHQLAGDIDGNNEITGNDIDLFYDIVNSGAETDPGYNLDGQGGYDMADVDYLVRDLLGTEYGDATLDKQVNLGDLAKLATNFGSVNVGWEEGDFTGDDEVNLADLAKLATSFGFDNSGGGGGGQSDTVDSLAIVQTDSASEESDDDYQEKRRKRSDAIVQSLEVNTEATISPASNWSHINDVVANPSLLDSETNPDGPLDLLDEV